MTSWDAPAETMTGDATHRPTRVEGDAPILGKGGEGTVVAGRDRHLPREVAWKVVAATDLRGVARLENEAALLASLEHPSIVPVYDLVRDASSVRLALKQVRGQTLSAALASAPSATARLRLLPHILAACHAVALAHHRGILHRDLKSANVMIGAFGETQVIDWGLACPPDAPTPGAVVGTPSTMSPEQARGEVVDERSDVWGLGTLLIELITGHPLFPNNAARATLDHLAHGRVPRWSAPPEVPRALIAIARRATHPHREARYADAAALADDLAALLDGRLVTAHRYSAWETFSRFVRAFRLPIAIGLTLAVSASVAALIAYQRIGDERDQAIAAGEAARAALVEAGLAHARRELGDDFRAEAELAAAEVLAIREDPEARGVIASFARAPRPERVATWDLPATPPRCRGADLSPDGRQLLCGDTDHHLLRIDLETGQRQTLWSDAYTSARFIGERVALTLPDQRLALIDRSGTVTEHPSCGGALSVTEGGLVDVHIGCVSYLGPDPSALPTGWQARCARSGVIQAATALANGYAVLCPDGTLQVRDPELRMVETPLVSPVGNYRAMAPLDRDTVVIGVSDGELVVLDHRAGRVLRRAYINPRRLIRAVSVEPTSQTIVAEVEGLGPLLIHAESLAPYARLPRQERASWLLPAGGEGGLHLSTLSHDMRTLSRWRVPFEGAAPIHLQEGRIGITSLSLDPHGLIGLTWSEHAELADATTGATLEHIAWPGLASGIAKAIAHDGPGAWVAVSAPEVARTLPADAAPLVGLGALRRMIGLRAPEEGPPRLVIADNSRKVFLLDPPDKVPLHSRLMPELAALGTVVATLSDPPRAAYVFDLSAAPLELSSCPAHDASTIQLLAQGAPESAGTPLFVIGDASGVGLFDLDCNLLLDLPSSGEPTILATTSAPAPAFGLIAAGTREGRIEVWDLTGRLLITVDAHTFPVRALGFAHDASYLASGAWDGRLRFYDVASMLASRDTLAAEVVRAWAPIR